MDNTQMAGNEKSVQKKLFSCGECGKCFTRMSNLNLHKDIVHEQVKLFRCRECGREFNDRSNLKKHKDVIHGQKKPFSCDECGKRFARKKILTAHKEGVKCGRGFIHRHHPKSHHQYRVACRGDQVEIENELQPRAQTHQNGDLEENVENLMYSVKCHEIFSQLDDQCKYLEIFQDQKEYPFQNEVETTVVGGVIIIPSAEVPEQTSNNSFSCYYCGTIFGWESGLEEHITTHLNKRENPIEQQEEIRSQMDDLYSYLEIL